MKIYVSPNFVIPGYLGKSFIEFEQEHVTLWDVLDELTRISSGKVKFLRPEKYVSEHDFWIKINGSYIDGAESDLKKTLQDGDMIDIYFITLGGG
jgi:hypothetical protein